MTEGLSRRRFLFTGTLAAAAYGFAPRWAIANACTPPAPVAAISGPGLVCGPTTLVLYDTTNIYGWLGELYGIMAANLAGHFGGWTAQPVTQYTAGQVNAYSAVIYIGSTYDEPLPVAFLDDVLDATKPVIWISFNIWQLTNRWAQRNPGGSFQAAYGWMWTGIDTSTVAEVLYKGQSLGRYAANNGGILNTATSGSGVVLASAVKSDGSTFPWGVRSGMLTYLGENPFVYVTEGRDRLLAFEDLLFDALAPATTERHRALLRLEDVLPTADPARLRAIGDYLASRGVPFGFGVAPGYRDPNGFYNGGVKQEICLWQRPAVIDALKYLTARGGVMVEHGWTHQYSTLANPYNGVSGDDFEFYRVVENPDHTLTYVGPVAEDSTAWVTQRFDAAAYDFTASGLAVPTIFEFPHYAASATAYRAAAARFPIRWERSLYFRGLFSGGAIDYGRLAGQRYSYVVRDVYGSKVLPENLGCIEPEPFHQFPTRFPAEIIADAACARVVRDGFASFFFHPVWDISYLKQTVEGLQAAGWTFVSPATL